jgi:uncharacterized protein YkwD
MSSPGWGYDYSRYDDEYDDGPEGRNEGEPRRRDPLRIVVVAIVALLALGSVAFLGSLAFSHPPKTTAGAATTTADPAQATPSYPAAPTTGASPTDPASPTPDPTTPAASPTTKRPTATPPQPTGNAGAEATVLQIVNAERAKVGCKPLTMDSRLTTAARKHSADMAARNYFSHTTPEGVTFDKRITAAGYRWSAAAENIAKGQRTAAEAMDAWMHSPGHRANILNCGYVNIGIGVVFAGRTGYWTQDFGTPLR